MRNTSPHLASVTHRSTLPGVQPRSCGMDDGSVSSEDATLFMLPLPRRLLKRTFLRRLREDDAPEVVERPPAEPPLLSLSLSLSLSEK
mmetsp:Transcript_76501/g.214610  ORF Transcript_76501/g.214610 Transcript_76501/m.214610 type:complete len:88 (+) Transcript_76501:1068-1331(+)